jgi:hypothetical protein
LRVIEHPPDDRRMTSVVSDMAALYQ